MNKQQVDAEVRNILTHEHHWDSLESGIGTAVAITFLLWVTNQQARLNTPFNWMAYFAITLIIYYISTLLATLIINAIRRYVSY